MGPSAPGPTRQTREKSRHSSASGSASSDPATRRACLASRSGPSRITSMRLVMADLRRAPVQRCPVEPRHRARAVLREHDLCPEGRLEKTGPLPDDPGRLGDNQQSFRLRSFSPRTRPLDRRLPCIRRSKGSSAPGTHGGADRSRLCVGDPRLGRGNTEFLRAAELGRRRASRQGSLVTVWPSRSRPLCAAPEPEARASRSSVTRAVSRALRSTLNSRAMSRAPATAHPVQ